jgi:hypothetical protein
MSWKEKFWNRQERIKRYRQAFIVVVVLVVAYAVIKALRGKEEFAGVIVALLIGLAGLMQDSIKSLFFRPALRTCYQSGVPYGHKVASRNAVGAFICDNYYFRIKIENTGNETMQDVEVVAEECYREVSPDEYEKVEDFLPLNLSWAHKPPVCTLPFIRDGFYWFCSFGYIRESAMAELDRYGRSRYSSSFRVVCTLDTITKPNSGEHILAPGDYLINLVITAKNLKPERRHVKLHLEDSWDDDRDAMFRKNRFSINEFADAP